MVRPPLWNIRYSSLLDDPFQECTFAVQHKESSAATVITQRNYATCCLTINLAQLTLNDKNASCSAASVENSHPVLAEPVTGTSDIGDENNEDRVEVPNDLKENMTGTNQTRELDEKSTEGPSPKRRRNHMQTD
ncbi:hypothetical protein OESDEN_02833 [Oesophagostomum dentatum]|uniref:Uncharacterized protein n=1 Tax=Oesophagostomum dentatum TaxID=61180 RepID=A0A0B1TN06_OESDE|nr:hypothetical protein OESDEN_02833 [Oesophagostomum dentatum]